MSKSYTQSGFEYSFFAMFFVDYDVMRLKSGMKVVEPGKEKNAERIDGVVATIVALARAKRNEGSDWKLL